MSKMNLNFKGNKSEQAALNDKEGVETDPIIRKIAKANNIDVKKLIKSKFEDLKHDDLVQLMEYTSVAFSKTIERKMIEEFRHDRPHLNVLLFNHNTRAATLIARRYWYKYSTGAVNVSYDSEEFLSSARFGLWQAANRFNLDYLYKGEPVKFLTFATPWMFRYISEMMHERRNKIPHMSLDASPFGNPDDNETTLGELIGADADEVDFDEAVLNCGDDLDAVWDDDLDNAAMEEAEDMFLVDKATGGTEGDELEEDLVESVSFESVAEQYMDSVSTLTKRKAEVTDTKFASKAIDLLCKTIKEIKDPEERIITLFVSRKFIRGAVKRLGVDASEDLATVSRMLKDVPKKKDDLLESLQLTDKDFNRLCNRYAIRRQGEE